MHRSVHPTSQSICQLEALSTPLLDNPNPIGMYGGLESMRGGGGHYAPPPPISAMNAPIDAKIDTYVEHVIKNKNWENNSTISFNYQSISKYAHFWPFWEKNDIHLKKKLLNFFRFFFQNTFSWCNSSYSSLSMWQRYQ